MTSRADVVARLTAAGCVAAEAEADELVGTFADDAGLETAVERRERGEPLAWITGSTTFLGRRLRVDPGVYVPRMQSEELARRAHVLLHDGRAADLCTGAGAIAAHLVAAHAGTVVGVDRDPRAVATARRNGVPAFVGDLGAALRSGAFDVVTAVAPYVPTDEIRLLPTDVRAFEPRHALDGGADGLEVVRRVVEDAARILRPGAWLLLELGGDQDRALGPALDERGFGDVESWTDDEGDLRGLAARLGR